MVAEPLLITYLTLNYRNTYGRGFYKVLNLKMNQEMAKLDFLFDKEIGKHCSSWTTYARALNKRSLTRARYNCLLRLHVYFLLLLMLSMWHASHTTAVSFPQGQL